MVVNSLRELRALEGGQLAPRVEAAKINSRSELTTYRTSGAELNRKQTGIAHHEAQPHGLACQGAEVAARPPAHHVAGLVADGFDSIRERVTGQRLPRGVLDLHANAAGSRGGEVEHQLLAAERQGLRQQFAAG